LLPRLFNEPTTLEEWHEWSFHHADSHQRIVSAIQAKSGLILPIYTLEPIALTEVEEGVWRPTADWLQWNQLAHQQMDVVVNVQSADLQDADLADRNQLLSFVWVHALEHQNVEQALGI
jgi:hypothetical protein